MSSQGSGDLCDPPTKAHTWWSWNWTPDMSGFQVGALYPHCEGSQQPLLHWARGGSLPLEDVWLMAEGLGGEPGPALALSLCLPVHSAIVHVSSGLLSRQRVRSPQVLGAHFSLLTSQSLKFASFYLCFFLKAFLLNICQIQ